MISPFDEIKTRLSYLSSRLLTHNQVGLFRVFYFLKTDTAGRFTLASSDVFEYFTNHLLTPVLTFSDKDPKVFITKTIMLE
jgi:hypothetical protein